MKVTKLELPNYEEGEMMDYRNVLDCGFVELVDFMGDDYRILQSARVSTGGEASKGVDRDRGLIRYLYKNQHLTPFEQVVTTWHVKAPIFVVRQWMRTRTASYNEYSGRYSNMISDYYSPDYLYYQSGENHQGSGDELDRDVAHDLLNQYESHMDNSWGLYDDMREQGVSKEQARMVLPVSQYTEFYMTINLRNLFHFLTLRTDEHAQWEIRQYANTMLDIMNDIYVLKWSMEAYKEFSALEKAFRNAINEAGKDTSGLLQTLERYTQVQPSNIHNK